MRDKHTVLGLGDGGAHYGLICDANYTTFLLSYWGRDRQEGRLDPSEAIMELSYKPLAVAGLWDRELLRPGYKADINVIDFDAMSLQAPRVDYDLPGGRHRLNQGARETRYCDTALRLTAQAWRVV